MIDSTNSTRFWPNSFNIQVFKQTKRLVYQIGPNEVINSEKSDDVMNAANDVLKQLSIKQIPQKRGIDIRIKDTAQNNTQLW